MIKKIKCFQYKSYVNSLICGMSHAAISDGAVNVNGLNIFTVFEEYGMKTCLYPFRFCAWRIGVRGIKAASKKYIQVISLVVTHYCSVPYVKKVEYKTCRTT